MPFFAGPIRDSKRWLWPDHWRDYLGGKRQTTQKGFQGAVLNGWQHAPGINMLPRPRNSRRLHAGNDLTASGSEKTGRKNYVYLYISHCIQTLLFAALRVGYRVRVDLFFINA
jgi:hypothetical protein